MMFRGGWLGFYIKMDCTRSHESLLLLADLILSNLSDVLVVSTHSLLYPTFSTSYISLLDFIRSYEKP